MCSDTGALCGAFKSSAWALSASHAAKQDKNIHVTSNTLPALKEIFGSSNARRGFCEVVEYNFFIVFFMFLDIGGVRILKDEFQRIYLSYVALVTKLVH